MDNYRFQVLSVPFCYNTIIQSINNWEAWNGETGGAVALITKNLDIQAPIDVSGIGFRGGMDFPLRGFAAPTLPNYADASVDDLENPPFNAVKGEGFIGSPRFLGVDTNYPNGFDCARGPPGNAGGGANHPDSGGGGGSNRGAGGTGGTLNTATNPKPGIGARSVPVVPPVSTDYLFLGGGGGAGARNDLTQPPRNLGELRGLAGGGLLYIHVHDTVVGNGLIRSSGEAPFTVPIAEGGGGGGAGGSVALLCNADEFQGNCFSSLDIDVSGGTGTTVSSNHGSGGGGGGGFFVSSTQTVRSVDLSGGSHGSIGTFNGPESEDGALLTAVDPVFYSSHKIFDNCPPSQTGTPTPSHTPSHTITPTSTSTFSDTPSPTHSSTPSTTKSTSGTPTSSVTPTGTSSNTVSPSGTSTSSDSGTPTRTPTKTASKTITRTPSTTKTQSSSRTITRTPSNTKSTTRSTSSTPTNTITPTQTRTGTQTQTQTRSTSDTSTGTRTPTKTASSTASSSVSPSGTPSNTQTQTATLTPTQTSFPSLSPSQSDSHTPSRSPTMTSSVSPTRTPSKTATTTKSQSKTISRSPTFSRTASISRSPSLSFSSSSSVSHSPSGSSTESPSGSLTPSVSSSRSLSETPAASKTASKSRTAVPSSSSSRTITPSQSNSRTQSRSLSPSISERVSFSELISKTPTSSPSEFVAPSQSSTPLPSLSSRPEASASPTTPHTHTRSASHSSTHTRSRSLTLSPSISAINLSVAIVHPEIPTISISLSSSRKASLSPSASKTSSFGLSKSPCIDCEQIAAASVALQQNANQAVPIISLLGNQVASLNIPENTEKVLPSGTSLQVQSLPLNDVPFGFIVSDIVLDLTLNNNGNDVELNGNVEICFSATALEDVEDGCLGFVNKQDEWECEDSCLTTNEDGEVCGNTPHFTNFAILLTGDTGGDPCVSSSTDDSSTILYLSCAFIIATIVILGVIVIFSEIRFRLRKYQIQKRLAHFAELSTNFSEIEGYRADKTF